MVDITAAEVFRDFVTDGVPSSGANKPRKPDIRKLLKQYETIIAAFTSSGGVIYASKAALDADLARPANTMAWVLGDAVAANNGIYRKVGASGAGNWVRAGDLPYSFILASNIGTGTPSAIQATTTIPVSGSALILLQIAEDYAGEAATVSFNGAAPLTIKTNSGEGVRNLAGGSVVYGVISGGVFRLANDEAIASLIYQARDEAVAAEEGAQLAQAAAEAARDIAAGYASDAISGGMDPGLSTVVGMGAITIPAGINHFNVAGYYAAGDGGGALYVKVDDEPVHAGKFQTADGAWWEIASRPISSKTFGARMDSSDDAAAINNALQFSAAKGLPVEDGSGTLSVGQTIVFPNGARWEGNNYQTFVKRLTGHTGALLKTENFDALTGTNDAFAAGVPERISVTGITFDGNYQNPTRTAYVQAAGEGLRVYARKISLHVRVFNTPGVGIWVECPGGNGPTPLQPGFSREADLCLYTHQTQYEGVVWKGPPDVKIGWILQADAGSRVVADQLNGKVSSPNYGAVNGGKTDGVVFDGKGAEITAMHCFGNFAGGGFDWRNGGRINADLIMVESCHFGGASIAGAAQGMISKFDIHRTGGFSGDATADFIYKGVGGNNYGLEIGTLASYRQDAANLGARNNVEIAGSFLDIGNVKIDNGSTATAGHGIIIDMDNAAWITIGGGEIARCKGTAPDGLASSAVYRKGTGTGSMLSIKANVRDCDVVFRSDGAPYVEEVDLQYYLNAGQLPFVGTVRTNITQEWNIRGRLGATRKVSHFEGAPDQAIFDPTLTTKQTLTIPHNLIHAPGFGRYQATGILDTPSSMTAGRIGFIQVISADDTNVTVEVQMAVANGSNTAPRVTILAEL